jgi:F0F1-type ATP synthase assembly protein I
MSVIQTEFKFWYAISLGLQLGFIVAAPIVGFIFFGLKVDSFFSTHPLFLLIGIGVGFAITVYEVYEWLLPLIKNEDKEK